MSTSNYKFVATNTSNCKLMNVGIVAALWNKEITDALVDGAVSRLLELGVPEKQIVVERVPGTVELTYAARQMVLSDIYDAVIMIGCVIKGDTPHFDYVCQSAMQGCTMLNATLPFPVIFCVLTALDEQQALDRAGGKHGNKGAEAADTAVEMINFYDLYAPEEHFGDEFGFEDFDDYDGGDGGDDDGGTGDGDSGGRNAKKRRNKSQLN